jgi:ribonuclease HII
MIFPDFKKELECLQKGYIPAGCDEVGVGPLAGPVVAAVCILNSDSVGKYRSKNKWYHRVRDSKTTSEEEREILLEKILENCAAYGVGEVWQEDIDTINIHHASLKAMRLAVEDMLSKFDTKGKKIFVIIDGRFKIPDAAHLNMEQESVIDGDANHLSIAAASIIAKVHRDKIMSKIHEQFPQYGFKNHKGYNTKEHQKAIKKWGISSVHRKSFLKSEKAAML